MVERMYQGLKTFEERLRLARPTSILETSHTKDGQSAGATGANPTMDRQNQSNVTR